MLTTFIKIILSPLGVLKSHKFYTMAKKLETEGKYKDACYEYAVALLNGGIINEGKVRKKISEIWQNYGPFIYEDEKTQQGRIGGKTDKCDDAGHAAVMSIIKESISAF